MFIKFLLGLLVCGQVFLYGCAATGHIPEAHRQHDREQDFPVGIVYTQYKPNVEIDYFIRGKAQGAGYGALGGLFACSETSDPLLFLLCAPIGISVGAVHGAVSAEPSDVVDNVEVDLHKSIPQSIQQSLANSVYLRLDGATANYPILTNGDEEDNIDDIDNYRTILKVILQNIEFESSGIKNDLICLRMKANATKLDATTNIQIDTMTTLFNGDCASYDDWFSDNGRKLAQEIESGYMILSENIADELYLVFHPSLKSVNRSKNIERLVPNFVLAPESPRLKEPRFSFEQPNMYGHLQATDVNSLTPTFRWEVFPRDFDEFTTPSNGPVDVTYEFRLYEGRLTTSGNLVEPSRVLHTARGLLDNYYAYPIELTPCTWYFWTVRANFNLNGYPRVTEWAGMYDTIGGKVYPSYSRRAPNSKLIKPSTYLYFPFRTMGC